MRAEKQKESQQILALLQWYQAAGVDICVNDKPGDQFSLGNNPVQSKIISARPPQTSDVASRTKVIAQHGIDASQGDPIQAKKIAQNAKTLEELRTSLENLEGCTLRLRATQLVFGEGNPDAQIMLVGKAPSKDDDLSGQAFSGNAGELLNNMLTSIGLDRTEVYLANIVHWRPPGNRDPAPHEVDMCLPFLKRQIELVAPKIIITLGEMAAKSLLEQNKPLTSLRGNWTHTQIGTHKTQILASLHPEFLLKQPAQKFSAWSDLQKLQKAAAQLCQTS